MRQFCAGCFRLLKRKIGEPRGTAMKRVPIAVLILTAIILAGVAFRANAAQEIRDPVKDAARKLDKQIKEQNYKELKDASAELLAISKALNDEVEKSDEHVISARIFEKVDKIEKLTKRIRDKA